MPYVTKNALEAPNSATAPTTRDGLKAAQRGEDRGLWDSPPYELRLSEVRALVKEIIG